VKLTCLVTWKTLGIPAYYCLEKRYCFVSGRHSMQPKCLMQTYIPAEIYYLHGVELRSRFLTKVFNTTSLIEVEDIFNKRDIIHRVLMRGSCLQVPSTGDTPSGAHACHMYPFLLLLMFCKQVPSVSVRQVDAPEVPRNMRRTCCIPQYK
jgi:hypothetical protein